MQEYLGLKDGDITNALVCFTDIARFTLAAKSLSVQQIARLLKQVSSIIAGHVAKTRGRVVKYIGDASLMVFPEEDVDTAIGELLAMKREVEEALTAVHPDLAITFSAHLGEIIIVQLEPFSSLDIMGDSVNLASRLNNQARGGGFAISQQVYERLSDKTRLVFKKNVPPAVYLAD
jgi:class 3 adenylate cyclase